MCVIPLKLSNSCGTKENYVGSEIKQHEFYKRFDLWLKVSFKAVLPFYRVLATCLNLFKNFDICNAYFFNLSMELSDFDFLLKLYNVYMGFLKGY